jgi:hypothetical protein
MDCPYRMDWSRDKKKNRTGCTVLFLGGLIGSVCFVPIGVVDSGRGLARVVVFLTVGDISPPTLADKDNGYHYRICEARPKDEPHKRTDTVVGR